MASSVFSTIIITFFISLQFFTLTISKPLVLPLKHSLSKTLYKNTPHLLKSTTTHSTTRLHHHRHHHYHHHVSLPLTPGSDYTLSFSLGSQIISLYMDTGSDIVWVPCHPFTCILCEGKYDPATIPNPAPLNLTTAAPVTCKSRACMTAHKSRSTSNLCAIANCPLEDIETSDCDRFSCPPFYFAYADGSFIGKLYTDNLEIPFSSPSLNIQNFTFGCAHTALAEPIGVAGFGRGALSMTSQLANTAPEIGNHFSYCLVSHSFDQTRVKKPSPLILGRYFSGRTEDGEIDGLVSNDMVFTPMLENPKHPYFYCVGLEGISVGKKRVESPGSLKRVDGRGNGGMVVDSGTTFTMLPAKFHESVVAKFRSVVGKVYHRASHIEENTGLSPCYYIDDDAKNVPKLVFHYGGNSSVVMPRKNYFYEFIDGGEDGKRKRKVGCLMLMNGGDEAESGGPAGLLGNYQQQGFEVVYDLEEKKLGFAPRKCSSLWDSLNQKN